MWTLWSPTIVLSVANTRALVEGKKTAEKSFEHKNVK